MPIKRTGIWIPAFMHRCVAFQCAQPCAAGGVPQPDGLVRRCRRQRGAILRELHHHHAAGVSPQRLVQPVSRVHTRTSVIGAELANMHSMMRSVRTSSCWRAVCRTSLCCAHCMDAHLPVVGLWEGAGGCRCRGLRLPRACSLRGRGRCECCSCRRWRLSGSYWQRLLDRHLSGYRHCSWLRSAICHWLVHAPRPPMKLCDGLQEHCFKRQTVRSNVKPCSLKLAAGNLWINPTPGLQQRERQFTAVDLIRRGRI
jgi:hypothetical protein